MIKDVVVLTEDPTNTSASSLIEQMTKGAGVYYAIYSGQYSAGEGIVYYNGTKITGNIYESTYQNIDNTGSFMRPYTNVHSYRNASGSEKATDHILYSPYLAAANNQ